MYRATWALLAMSARKPTEIISAIQTRMQGIREWMAEECPYVTVDQRHLDANTPERAYWHYGYQAALSDVLAMMEGRSSRERRNHRRDSHSQSPQADLDE